MYPDERVSRFITDNFIPARVHVRDQADFKKWGERYGASWTPTLLVLDPEGNERHRVEGFLPADDLLAQLTLGLGHSGFKRGDYAAGQRWFGEVVDKYPQAEPAAEAQYWTGVSAYKATNDASALKDTARKFTEKYADSSWAKKASVWAA